MCLIHLTRLTGGSPVNTQLSLSATMTQTLLATSVLFRYDSKGSSHECWWKGIQVASHPYAGLWGIMWKPGSLTNQLQGFNAHLHMPKLIKCRSRGSLSSWIMNSGGTVTRDVTEAKSYLATFLLGILKQLQHLLFVPPSILSHPSNIFDNCIPSTLPGTGDTAMNIWSTPLRGSKSCG